MRAQRERLRRGFYTGLTVLEDSLRKFCTMTELTASWRSSLARKLSIGNCVGVPTASSGPFGPAIFGMRSPLNEGDELRLGRRDCLPEHLKDQWTPENDFIVASKIDGIFNRMARPLGREQ